MERGDKPEISVGEWGVKYKDSNDSPLYFPEQTVLHYVSSKIEFYEFHPHLFHSSLDLGN